MRRLIATVLLLLTLPSPRVRGENVGGTTDVIGGETIIETLVGHSTVGGIPRPPGTASCSPWAILDQSNPAWGAIGPDAPVTRTNPVTGTVLRLFARLCDAVTQTVWVPDYSAEDLAQVAFQQVRAQVPRPLPTFTPPAESMFVNIDTHLTITPINPVTATASIPGLTSTVTATPIALRLQTGSKITGDTTIVTCNPWASPPADECVWTPRYPSAPQVTGTDDLRYHAQIVIVWQVTWTANNQHHGDLGTIETTTDVPLTVREIQTY